MNATVQPELLVASDAANDEPPAADGAFEVVDTAPSIQSTALAPLGVIEQGLTALREAHGGKDYEIQTTKGHAEAVADRLAIRNARYKIPHIVKEQKALLKKVGTDLDAFAERLNNALLEIETPITVAIDAEALRKKKAKEDAEKKKAALATAAQEVIEAIRGRITLAVGQAPTAILEIITVCEAIESSEEEHGERMGEVLRAKSETLAKLREMHAAQVQWEKTQAEARETQRKAALQTKIDAFGRAALEAIGKSSADVQKAIDTLEAMDITAEVFAERAHDAIDAQQRALTQLDSLLKAAQATEAAAASAAATKAEQDRLTRQREEQEAEQRRQEEQRRQNEQQQAELERQRVAQAEQAASLENTRAQQIDAAILAIENLPASLNAEMTSETLSAALVALRNRKLGVVEFGGKISAARAAHAAAVAKVEALVKAAIDRECREAEEEADALPPAAPPAPTPAVAPIEAPVAPPDEAAGFLGMFNPAPAAGPAPAAVDAPVKTITPAGILAALQQTTAALGELMNIVRESSGVIGYRDESSVVDWDEFEEVTRASMALTAGQDALDANGTPF